MSNRLFDILRTLCEIVIPAIGALYFAVAKIWQLPYGTEITGTCAARATFLGALIGVNLASYNAYQKEQDYYQRRIKYYSNGDCFSGVMNYGQN